MNKKVKNKCLIIMSIFLILVSSIIPNFANAINLKEDLTLRGYGSVPYHLKSKALGGGYVSTHLVGYYEKGNFYPAYCMNVERSGADNSHDHTINLMELLKDTDKYNKVWRVVTSGYPYHTAEQLGVDDWQYAYQATKTAIYCVLGQANVDDYYADDEIGQKTVNLIKKLVNEGNNGSETYKTPVANVTASGKMTLSGNYYIQNYKVTSNVDIKSFDVAKTGFPNGTLITNTNGTEKDTFNANETFQIRLPKDMVETSDINGKIRVDVSAKSYAVFYGKTYDENLQNYAVTADPVSLTNTTVNVNLKGNTGSIKIKKVDEDTNEAIEGVTFELRTDDGKLIGTATTDKDGKLVFNNLYQDVYVLKEIKANNDYVILQDTVDIPAYYNKVTEKTITNKHKTGNLKIYKVDKDNNKITLGGVEFELYSEEFDKVIGNYVTNADGEIYIENLRTGDYKLHEKATNKWYNLADDNDIVIKWDETTDITVENELKKSQIKVIKVDKENHEVKLKDVEFEVMDQDGNVLETIKTNEDGEAMTSRYSVRDYPNLYLRETITNEKYVLDDTIHKVELKENEIVNQTFENQKIKGQIKIIKTAEDDNKITGDKKGTPIPNVEFDIFDENKNYIETITTGEDGTAITSLLEKGVKYIKEKTSGEWYLLNENEYTAEIVKHGEIVELNITNKPENPNVDIEKTGIIQTTANQEIRYDFKIKNTGNVPLNNFTWFDYLPTDYVRITKLITGTYNQDLNYSIYYKTNKNDYRILKDNLNTKVNNYIDFSNLELEEDEYVTDFKADFGKVDVGFESEINPYIFVRVNSDVKEDDTFTNKTRIEGYHKTYMVWDEDDHTTKIYEKKIEVKKLPRTGV